MQKALSKLVATITVGAMLVGCTASRTMTPVNTMSRQVEAPPPQQETRKAKTAAGVDVSGTSIRVNVSSGSECRQIDFQRTEERVLYRNELDDDGKKTQRQRLWGSVLLALSGGVAFAMTCDMYEDPSQCDPQSLNTGKNVAGAALLGTGALVFTMWAITKAKKGETEVRTNFTDQRIEGDWASCGTPHGVPNVPVVARFRVPRRYGSGYEWGRRWGEVATVTDMAGNATIDLSSALVTNGTTVQEKWPEVIEISTKTSDGRYPPIASISVSQVPALAALQQRHAQAVAKEEARQRRVAAEFWAAMIRMGAQKAAAERRYYECRDACLRSSVSATWAACHARCKP